MAAADYTSLVQQIYISYFGRPADTLGLANYAAQLNALSAPTTMAGLLDAAKTNASLSTLVNSFGTSAESVALYGTDTVAFVSAIYVNVLNRTADFDGLLYWAGEINAGRLTKAAAALNIANGALSNTSEQGLIDAATLAAKTTIATNFTAAIDTTPELNAYSGNAAAASARDLLKTVTSTTVPEDFQANVDAAIAALVTADNPPPTPKSLVLTTGVDAGATFVAGAGDDTFIAATTYLPGTATKVNTLTALDSLNGGAGADTLSISSDDTAAYVLASNITLSNIEKISISGAADVTADITASSITGVTALEVTKAAAVSLTAGSATDVTVSGATADITVAGGSSQTVTTELGAGDDIVLTKGGNVAVTATKLVGSDVGTAGTITVGAGAASNHATGTVSINTTGAAYTAADTANSLGAIEVNGGTVVTVTQTAYSATTAAPADLSGAVRTQGAVTVHGDDSTTAVVVNQSAAVGAVSAVTAAGRAETASVVFSTMLSGQNITIGGLTFTATKDLTVAEVASVFANLTENDTTGSAGSALGYYSGTLSGWTSGAVTAAGTVLFTSDAAADVLGNVDDLSTTVGGTAVTAVVAPQVAPVVTAVQGVSFIEGETGVAGVAGGAVTIDESGATTHKIASVTLNGAGAATIASNALNTLSLANSTSSVAVTHTPASSTLGLTLDNVGAAAGADPEVDAAVNLGGSYTTLNVHTAGTNSYVSNTAGGVKSLTVDGTKSVKFIGDFSALETVVVTGSAGLDIAASTTSTMVSVNTTGTTGSVTSSIDVGTTYAGGAGVDSVTVGATTKALTLGDGNDTLVVSSVTAFGAGGSVDAGAGTGDTLSVTAAQAVTMSADGVFENSIANFEILKVNAASAAGTIDLANLDDINKVTSAGASDSLLIKNFGANGTLTLTGAVTVASEARLATASGASDVFNIVLSKGTAINNTGALTVENVETINITATDTSATVLNTHTLTLVDTKAKTINVSGNAGLTLTNDAGNIAVTLIDGSTMTGGTLTAGTTNTTVAETIKGGAGDDVLTSNGNLGNTLIGGAGDDTLNAGAGLDTLTGGTGADTFYINAANLNVNSYATITDFSLAQGDAIIFTGANKFAASKVVLGATAVFQDYCNAAINAIAVNELSWFQYGGDTYVVMDAGNNSTAFTNSEDKIVKITGLVDLSTVPFSNTSGGLNGTVAASLMQTMDAASVAMIDGSGITTVTGTAALITSVYGGSGFTDLGNEVLAASDTGSVAATVLTNLDSLSTGAVGFASVSNLTGTAAQIQAAYTANTAGTITGLGNETATASDTGSVAATVLTTLDGVTTGAVGFAGVTALTGTAAEIQAAYTANTAGTITGLGNEAVTASDVGSVAATVLTNLDAATTGVVGFAGVTTLTGTAAEVLAAYAANTAGTITGLGNEAVTVSDTGSVAATVLTTLDGVTTGAVGFAGVTTLTGTAAEIQAAYTANTATTITGLGNEIATASDTGSVAATVLTTLDGVTTGVVGFAGVTTLTGTAAEIQAAYTANTAGTVSGLGNEIATASDVGSVAATVLTNLDAVTTGVVSFAGVTTLTGTAAEVNAAYAANTAGTITGLGNEIVTLSGTTSAADFASIAALSSGAVSATTLSLITATIANMVAGDSFGTGQTFSNHTSQVLAADLNLDWNLTGNMLTIETLADSSANIIITLTGITTVTEALGVFTIA